MRRFGTLTISETLYFGSSLILTVLAINIISGIIGFLSLYTLEENATLSFVLAIVSLTVMIGGYLGLGMKVVSDSISIGLTLHDSTKNPFILKPKKPSMANENNKKKTYAKSDIERAMAIFPGTDEETISGYFEQGWTIEKLEQWASEKNS